MQIAAILQELDQLLHACKLEEADAFLRQAISQAQLEQDRDGELTLRNEQIGFFRDCGRFPEALDTAAATRKILEEQGDVHSIPYATTLLNCANAYRAAGAYDMAFAAYETVKTLYDKLLPETDGRVASFWNNLALLYQETSQWEEACQCLEQALELVRLVPGNEVRIGISCTNLAVCLLRLRKTEEAMELLREADEILSGKTPSDFHYSATLAAFGDAYYQKQQYSEAAASYEAALPEIELHMGQNNFYAIVSDNLEQTYKAMGTTRPQLSGMELSRRFYEQFGAPMLERNFGAVLPCLAIGLAGEGSECLGFDDNFSRDHDFGPGFCIWIPDDMPEETAAALQSAYDALPKSYYGYQRVETPEAVGRVGVCRIGDFFRRLIGLDHVPQTETEWLFPQESMLAAVCSGELFRDDSKVLTKARQRLRYGCPRAVLLRRLAQHLARMAQCGQYNFFRMRQRGDYATAQLYLAEFCKNAMEAAHLLRRTYAPYEKWLLKSTKALDGFAALAADVEQLLLLSPKEAAEQEAREKIHRICESIRKEVAIMEPNMAEKSGYLADTANALGARAAELETHDKLVEEIAKLEFDTFDSVQNLGGRAGCQDDWETFSIMRRSQYQPWETPLLEQWLGEFKAANQAGRNLITEKYARMMESTDPELYANFADQLPFLSPEFIQLREAIIQIQISWMEQFAEKYPQLALRARIIHTAEDSKWETSYETYLRGELSVYSFALLYDYGRWIVSLHQRGENLSEQTMLQTVLQYGYESLEAAELAYEKELEQF